MINKTLSSLRCPSRGPKQKLCGSELELFSAKSVALDGAPAETFDVIEGHLKCTRCKTEFPILAGVAILVDDVHSYLIGHVKGLSELVPDSAIPKKFRADFIAAREELETQHIDEDLESQRVTALYVATHYLHAGTRENWWQAPNGESSPLIDSLIREHWNNGPLAKISKWIENLPRAKMHDVVELGCGVGGLYPRIQSRVGRYLGVDSSFASIALARHLALGAKYPRTISIPSDLIDGPLAKAVQIAKAAKADGSADFVVGDLEALPVARESWSVSVALNAIDMLERPALLPELQQALLSKNGIAIQSCPYVWHESVAASLRKTLSKKNLSSSQAVEALYEKAGFSITERIEHLPWLFFKHARQLEIYSVHLLEARKNEL